MTNLTDLKKALRNAGREIENKLEVHDANNLDDTPVFDRGRRPRERGNRKGEKDDE